MAHHHDHDHCSGHHHHAPVNNSRIFGFIIVLNLIFIGIELAYGFIAHSTALLADAGHNVSDVLGLLMAWAALALANKKPSKRYTYGLRSSTILAALANSMLLLVACGAIGLEAVQRLSQPHPVAGLTVSVVAGAGLLTNGLSALILMRGNKNDINVRGAFLHMAADAAVSLAVVIAGVAMLYTDWYWLDPLISLVIVLVILIGTWGLLREALRLALSAVPTKIDSTAIDNYLRQLDGVNEIHDLHIWGLSTTENALTVHLVMPNGHPGDDFMDDITATLKHHYDVHHSTLQIELGTTQHACSLAVSEPTKHRH
ncbi:MAG: cation diffusion facilitator family transporter [Methylococcales bacterium]